MSRTEQRNRAVAETVARVRAIERQDGVTRESLARMKHELLALAERRELFPAEDFLPPPAGDERNSCLYRLSEDDDHRFALYINAARAGTHSPAHNHTTWAVIVGLQGEELNKMYDRVPGTGVAEKGQAVVKRDTGVAFLPDDLHSIHIEGDGVTLNFHMYGLALEQLHRREYWRPKDGDWRVFPAHSDIRDARG